MESIITNKKLRTKKTRKEGITMMIDKGISLSQAKYFLETSKEYTDIIKLGFGTSIITPNIIEKVRLYQKNNIQVYLGGTLFEYFFSRNKIKEYEDFVNHLGISMVEISDGCIDIDHSEKCNQIKKFSKNFIVLSEVGSKTKNIENDKWLENIEKEIIAGSWKIIAEAREGGNIGICEENGDIKSDLIDDIVKKTSIEQIIWEAPKKSQQSWFINKFGLNVNLGNISYDDIIPLECLRLGLRADTFKKFL